MNNLRLESPSIRNQKISIKNLKASFTGKFSNSIIFPLVISLPDELIIEELIGAVGVWLNILELESANNLKGGK
jgi:hypothetical protein